MGEQGTRESFFHPPPPFSLFVIIRVFFSSLFSRRIISELFSSVIYVEYIGYTVIYFANIREPSRILVHDACEIPGCYTEDRNS